jgi:effector-binding domain-containing protein
MKKGFLVALIVILIIGLALISFYPVTQNSTINIEATFDNTVLQVMHVENWKNWFPEIKKAYQNNPLDYRIQTDSSKKVFTIYIPGKKYIIRVISPVSYEVNEIEDNLENNFAFTVFPFSEHKINLYLVEKRPLLISLFDRNKADTNPLKGLKSYLEDPKQLYGFDIKMAEIRDPTIASTVFKIPQKDVFNKIQKADTLLRHYIAQKNLIKTGHISISYIPLNGDSLQVTVGIPVNGSADSIKDVKCLSLPVKGKVLVGSYTGQFSKREIIYQAMSKYLTDHRLSIPAESFERYLNDSIPINDSSEIKIELDYPVY